MATERVAQRAGPRPGYRGPQGQGSRTREPGGRRSVLPLQCLPRPLHWLLQGTKSLWKRRPFWPHRRPSPASGSGRPGRRPQKNPPTMVAHGESLQDPEEEEEEGGSGIGLGLGLDGPVAALWPGGLFERWRDLIQGYRYSGNRCGGGRGAGDDDQEARLLAESIAMSFGGGPSPLLLLPPPPPPLPPLEGAGTGAGVGGLVMREADQRGQLSGEADITTRNA